MALLDTLKRGADEEQLVLNPLPLHVAHDKDEALRQQYGRLLAAVLTAEGQVSEAQTRLFRLLLDALKLGDARAALFEQASQLAPPQLLESARQIRRAELASYLLLDTLVLLRLDAPLTDTQAQLVGELAAFLGQDDTELARCASDAAHVLGLALEEEETAPTVGAGFNTWPGARPQTLTREALKGGLKGGIWLLESDLTVDFPWQAEKATLHFQNGARLTCTLNNPAHAVKLEDCNLHNAVMQCTGMGRVNLMRCTVQGHYPDKGANTALKVSGASLGLTATHCQFATTNAQSIHYSGTSLLVTQSVFTGCGHPNLPGGAILIDTITDGIIIENNRFEQCVGSVGGAIYMPTLTGIKRCEFITCRSTATKQALNLAVTASKSTKSQIMESCRFKGTSINLGDTYMGYDLVYLYGCIFEDSNIYFHHRESKNKTADSATQFSGTSRAIEMELHD